MRGLAAVVALGVAGQAHAQPAEPGTLALLKTVCLPYFQLGGDSNAAAERVAEAGFTVADATDGQAFLLEPPAEWFDAGFTEVYLDPGGQTCTVLVEELAGDRTGEVLAELERWIAAREAGWRFAPAAPEPLAEGDTAPLRTWESPTHVLAVTRFHDAGLGMSIEVDLRRKAPPAPRRRGG